jgi:hypothetical protein
MKTVMFDKPVSGYAEAMALLPLLLGGRIEFVWQDNMIVGYKLTPINGWEQEAQHGRQG